MIDETGRSWCPSPKKRLGSEKVGEMSKRFFAACMAMQGFIMRGYGDFPSDIAEKSFEYSDELLKQEYND
jgi:hypothetical protein